MHRIQTKPHHQRQGFTLLELLLFVSLSGILLGALSVFLVILLNARVKQHTIVEVEEQGVQIMELTTSRIRSSPSITSPAVGSTSTSRTV